MLREKNIYWDICSLEDFMLFWGKEHKCEYCGLKQEDSDQSLQIDRKDNKIGYLIENITFACKSCNMIKGDIFTYSEMKEIGERYIKPKRYKP